MLIEDAVLRVGGEEIGKGQHGKQNDCQHIGQPAFQVFHIIQFVFLRAKVVQIE